MNKPILTITKAAAHSSILLLIAAIASAQTCVQPPPGMVGWWPGDGNATDIAGNNDGMLVGDTTYASGLVGDAFDFDGLNDYVEIPADPSLQFGGDFTVDVWVIQDTLATCNYKSYAHHQDFTNKKGWMLLDNCPSNPYILFRTLANNSFYDAVFSRTLLVPGKWHHIAGVHRGNANEIYLDGVKMFTRTYAPFEPNLGADLSSGRNVDGRIDELEIFDRALSAAEILGIYDAGSAGKCKPVNDSDGDGVADDVDLCSATVIPEGLPTVNLNPNHWALTADSNGFDFDTVIKGNGKGPNRSYTIKDTVGCSCEQIIGAQGLDNGQTKYGCSIGTMDNWVELVNP